ncbi:alpha/beta hydrolase fold domain-containing protein [Gottfriedia sp. NPDC056225]|uniref:alpha/beta hydrolase fold domain-containing protein n=1 Tax=Gottfriedia sp. NPDC056225 TaxID=3345751 RepID=UPI00155A033D|nr:alpha/beta hydrolase fold domain-containing protein [Arthrobacter citreus]
MNFRVVIFIVIVLTFFSTTSGCSQQEQRELEKLPDGVLLAASELSYEAFLSKDVGKSLKEHKGIVDPLLTQIHKSLSDYRLVSMTSGNIGFSAIALKNNKNNSLLFAFSGIKKINLQDIYQRLVGFESPENGSPVAVDDQALQAYDWVKSILNKKENNHASVYVTGHSFGGYLAQYVGYQLNHDKQLKNHLFVQGVTFNSLGVLLDDGSKKLQAKTQKIQKSYKPLFTNYIVKGDPLDYASKTFFKQITGYSLQQLGNVKYITVDENYKSSLEALEKTTDLWTKARLLKPLYPYHDLVEFESTFWK